jgi:HAE1 family hydrophobic/amphiphilic exporter-1
MFGFVLAIGIVVDDAIVVVEAVQHYIDNEKLSAKEATKKAMNDISGPVVAIALILAAVFVPVGFIPGIVGRLYQQFAITIAISVLISAFVALSLTPALCSILLKPHDQKRKPKGIFEKFFNAFNTRFESFTGRYTRWVNYFIKYARYVVILLVCIFVGTFLLFKTKATSFIPKEDDGRLYVTYEIPEASSTTRSLTVLDSIMTIMKSTPGIAHFAGIGGLNVVTFSNKSNSGTLFTMLKPWDERKDKSQQLDAIISTLQKRLATIKQARIVIIPPPAIPGLGRTGGFTFELQQQQSTDSIQEFENVVQNFVAALNKRPEIDRAFTYFTAKTPGYNVTVDRDKCEKMGVNVSDVYTTLATYLGSSYVNDFTIYGRNFRVVAQADTGYRKNIQEIGGYYVRNQQGTMVPLSTLVSYAPTENASVISHFNLFRTAEVNGDAAPGYSSGDAINALKETAAKVLPDGYGYEFGGLTREEISAGSKSITIFALSILFTFLFLAALYESWSVPFSVLLAVPLSAFGAILILHFLPNLSNNIYAQIGLITLIGLAAKNAILIVEFAKERVDKGMDVIQATLAAVKLRLRPILMTSLAFIFGVAPLAFASGAGAQARSTIGWTVLGGMFAATFLGIFIIPVLYVIITKIAYRKRLKKQNSGV